MFNPPQFIPPTGDLEKTENFPASLPPAIGGINSKASLLGMSLGDAIILNNFIPYPDRLETRPGYTEHITGAADTLFRLWPYVKGTGSMSLWGTSDSGIYNCTSAGALPAASIALTEGKTSAAVLATGANTYLHVVNGVDTLKQYDGTSWSSVATFSGGAYATDQLVCAEVYRQRLFYAERNSLKLQYLPINSISGTLTSYDLGAIFRQGGYILAIGTWTLDSGAGPDDQLAVVSSNGEVAVFAGSDPSSAATWALRGVYYIGKPLGNNPLFKYGGDLLFLSENGIYPLSQAVQSVSIDRTRPITDKVRAYFNQVAREFRTSEGWQVIAQPDVPLLIVNIPSAPLRTQLIMHAQSGAWATWSGHSAYSWARLGTSVYYSTATGVNLLTGVADNGANITATFLQAYSDLRYPRKKQIVGVKPYFRSEATFTYSVGIAEELKLTPQQIAAFTTGAFGTSSLWGTGIWGSAVWGGAQVEVSDWLTVSDGFSRWKALYLQTVSRQSTVEYLGSDALYKKGKTSY